MAVTPGDAGFPLVAVTAELPVICRVEGSAGVWSFMKRMRLARVPVAGDMIELADGWCCDDVESVIFSDGGEVEVRLRRHQVTTRESLDEINTLVTECGWEKT